VWISETLSARVAEDLKRTPGSSAAFPPSSNHVKTPRPPAKRVHPLQRPLPLGRGSRGSRDRGRAVKQDATSSSPTATGARVDPEFNNVNNHGPSATARKKDRVFAPQRPPSTRIFERLRPSRFSYTNVFWGWSQRDQTERDFAQGPTASGWRKMTLAFRRWRIGLGHPPNRPPPLSRN